MKFQIGQKVSLKGHVNTYIISSHEIVPDTEDLVAGDSILRLSREPGRALDYKAMIKSNYDSGIEGMVLGWTTRRVGWLFDSKKDPEGEYQPARLEAEEVFQMWVVMPLGRESSRYRRPRIAFHSQIEPIG